MGVQPLGFPLDAQWGLGAPLSVFLYPRSRGALPFIPPHVGNGINLSAIR
jgi:hypothetical protein